MKRRDGSGAARAAALHLCATALVFAGAVQACDARPLPLTPSTAAGGAPGTGGNPATGGTPGAGGATTGGGGTAGAGAGGACGSPACAPGTILEFRLLPRTLHRIPNGITAGPDGNLWFTERQGDAIGRITTSGMITEFPLMKSLSQPTEIVAGPDGHLWFTMPGINAIGRIAIDGTIQTFVLPTPNSMPAGIAAGPDGNVWFTEMSTSRVGYFLPSGQLTEYPTPTPGAQPSGIVAGKDGNLWFAEPGAKNIGVISPRGDAREIPAALGAHGMALAGDGDIWFTVPDGDQVGTITGNGSATLFGSPAMLGHGPWAIARGPRGELWYTYELDTDRIGELTRLAARGESHRKARTGRRAGTWGLRYVRCVRDT